MRQNITPNPFIPSVADLSASGYEAVSCAHCGFVNEHYDNPNREPSREMYRRDGDYHCRDCIFKFNEFVLVDDPRQAVEQCPFVFVYGTLKKGFGNHRIVTASNGARVGSATTLQVFFRMHSINGMYPGVVITSEDGGGELGCGPIKGEVYRVDSIDLFDSLEGYPNLYTRQVIDVVLASGETQTAWIYLFNRAVAGREVIRSGNWTRR